MDKHENFKQILSVPQIAEMACIMEVMSEKPGNVSPGKPFEHMNAMSFIMSAKAMAAAFEDESASIGEMIESAVISTKNIVNRNANLGIVLLLAPLVKTARKGQLCRESLKEELLKIDEAGLENSQKIYRAIGIAAPTGLGESRLYDVNKIEKAPDLMTALKVAADWDSVAREYVTGYEITFEFLYPKIAEFWGKGYPLKISILQTFLILLSEIEDTLIARKNGSNAAREARRLAKDALDAGGYFSHAGKEKIKILSKFLEDTDNLLNPGTSADLISAGIFVFLVKELEKTSMEDILQRWESKV